MPTEQFPELKPSARLLLGPGPSNVNPRVLRAMSAPMIGHLDPEFIALMEDSKKLLRLVFRTANTMTLPLSGTGSSGMEAAMANLIEPGDEIVVGVNGVFGGRMVDCAQRLGAKVHEARAEWGQIVTPEAIEAALAACAKPKLVALVHAETSTGVWQPVEEISRLAHRRGALLMLDAVTSLGCIPVNVDEWQVDICFSCTQKGLSAPPGLAPLTVGERALSVIQGRQSKCVSWYLDLAMIAQYWGQERVYHHTAPISMNYALYEALRIVAEEGLEARFTRHARHAAALHAGVRAMGLELAAQEGHRLPQLTTVKVPAGVDEARVRSTLLADYNMEIGAGLGPLRGKIWRIGLMGESAQRDHVVVVLSALEAQMAAMGVEVARGRALAAAEKVYAQG